MASSHAVRSASSGDEGFAPRRSRRQRRLAHWAVLAVVTTAGLTVGLAARPYRSTDRTLSLALAYLGLGGALATLTIGPLRRLLTGRNPVSQDLRRDIGIWTALVSSAHAALALGPTRVLPLERYFTRPGANALLHPRTDDFGAANILGLLAVVLMLGLAAISNDRMQRRLGRNWKRVQRANYAVGTAAAVHTMLFWSLLDRGGPLVTTASLVVTGVLVLRVAAPMAGGRRARYRGLG